MIELKNITKVFSPHTINEKIALDNVSLTIEDNEFVTVIGSNGAGKSTLLNAMAGVWPIDQGQILLDGEDITSLPDYKRAKYFGRVFQDPSMGTASSMQIEENLALAMRKNKKRGLAWQIKADERNFYKEQLKRLNLGLEDRLEERIANLSGGQRQAVTLLMASLVRPKLLLLDEHTAALDPKTADIVLRLTSEIIENDHLSAFMVTHNMKDAIKYGNRLIMMSEGKIVLDIKGEDKKALTVVDLMKKFELATGEEIANDQ